MSLYETLQGIHRKIEAEISDMNDLIAEAEFYAEHRGWFCRGIYKLRVDQSKLFDESAYVWYLMHQERRHAGKTTAHEAAAAASEVIA